MWPDRIRDHAPEQTRRSAPSNQRVASLHAIRGVWRHPVRCWVGLVVMPEFSVSLAPEAAPPAVTVVGNFGIVAGRRASRTDIEKLWRLIKSIVPQATITVEDHNQFGERTSTYVHQVSVAVNADVVRDTGQDAEVLRKRLEEELADWLAECAGRVQGEMTFAQRRARHAVIDKS